MATTTRRTTVDAPVERVWAVLADFAGTHRWNPEVPVSYAVGDQTTGLGARRRCEFDDAGRKWLEETIIAFDEPGHRYTLRLVDGTAKPPIDDVTVEIAAAAATADRTEVTFTATLTGRGPAQRAMAGVGALALRRVLGRVLAGLDDHLAGPVRYS